MQLRKCEQMRGESAATIQLWGLILHARSALRATQMALLQKSSGNLPTLEGSKLPGESPAFHRGFCIVLFKHTRSAATITRLRSCRLPQQSF